MEFSLTAPQEEIIKAAGKFARREFQPDLARELDKTGRFPAELHKKAADLGFTSICIEEALLGSGLGLFENVLMAETLCRQDSTTGIALLLAGFGSELMQRFGSEELKRQFLIPVVEGALLSGTSFPAVCSDIPDKSLTVRGDQQGEYWVLNGTLRHVVNGKSAGFYYIPCQMSGTNSETLGYLVVDSCIEGLSVLNTGEKTGMRMTDISDLQFRNARVHQSRLIGSPENGTKQISIFRDLILITVAALALGVAQGALDRAITYTRQREQFRRKLAEFQITRHKLSSMALSIEQSRFLVYRAAWLCDQSKIDTRTAAMSALSAIATATACSHEAIQLLGGYGFTTEYDVERFCRDARMLKSLCGVETDLWDSVASDVIGKIRSSNRGSL